MRWISGWLLVIDLRDLLQEHGLSGLRRGDDQAPLPFADRRDQVDDAGRKLGGIELEANALGRILRDEVLERGALLVLLQETPLIVVTRATPCGTPGRVDKTEKPSSSTPVSRPIVCTISRGTHGSPSSGLKSFAAARRKPWPSGMTCRTPRVSSVGSPSGTGISARPATA